MIGTASTHNHDYLQSLGATPVSYGKGIVDRVNEIAPQGVDVALDAAGEDVLRGSVEIVRDWYNRCLRSFRKAWNHSNSQ